ncbi:MAG: DUF3307 domain-containing protein [Bdellovibrionales bacterium]|nr:DUF3307 domain-containing protein [Bdellovibrionales bacterium]
MATLTEMELFLVLLVCFQIKHFLCDFPLQREFMVTAKSRRDWSFFVPLLMHASIHAIFSLMIILVIKPQLLWLALVDLFVHFSMDRIKSGPRYLGRFNQHNTAAYWNCFGFDQMVHHFTHYFIIWSLIA